MKVFTKEETREIREAIQSGKTCYFVQDGRYSDTIHMNNYGNIVWNWGGKIFSEKFEASDLEWMLTKIFQYCDGYEIRDDTK